MRSGLVVRSARGRNDSPRSRTVDMLFRLPAKPGSRSVVPSATRAHWPGCRAWSGVIRVSFLLHDVQLKVAWRRNQLRDVLPPKHDQVLERCRIIISANHPCDQFNAGKNRPDSSRRRRCVPLQRELYELRVAIDVTQILLNPALATPRKTRRACEDECPKLHVVWIRENVRPHSELAADNLEIRAVEVGDGASCVTKSRLQSLDL